MRWILPVCGVVLGSLCGSGAYFAADTFINWRPLIAMPEPQAIRATHVYRHTGTVVSHDMTQKTITIQEPSSFGIASSTNISRFTYDDATEWSSIEYSFRSGYNEKRILVENERERQLPEGTLIALSRDPLIETPWQIAKISFLRRTDL